MKIYITSDTHCGDVTNQGIFDREHYKVNHDMPLVTNILHKVLGACYDLPKCDILISHSPPYRLRSYMP